MLGLFGTLDLGTRSLQAQRQGVEVTGQNLANVNNPAYARQRLVMRTSPTVSGTLGAQGTGVQGVSIQQLRDELTDQQIRSENSVSGFLKRQQSALENAETQLGETLQQDPQTGAITGVSNASANGILSQLNNLFSSFQSLASDPTSLNSRQNVVSAAQELTTRLHGADRRLSALSQTLNDSVSSDTAKANAALKDLADLNHQIVLAEAGSASNANELRDQRQEALENLASLLDFNASENENGSVNITVGGTLLVSGNDVLDQLETFDAGTNQLMLRTTSGATLSLTGGSIQGAIDARDGVLGDLKSGLDSLAGSLVTEINQIHSTGFSLSGATGTDFFSGSTAADISLNADLLADPGKLQASGDAAAAGDNQVALSLARLANQPLAALNGQTFAQQYTATVTNLGQSLNSTNAHLNDQTLVQSMLKSQRDSVSGVSVDEEMTNMMKYQKAFEASAKLVSTVSEMLDNVINLKR